MKPKNSKNNKNSNRDGRIHSRLVRRHVWEPDKECVAYGLLPYLEILKGRLKDIIFARQLKMAHELLSSLPVNQKRTLKSSGFLF